MLSSLAIELLLLRGLGCAEDVSLIVSRILSHSSIVCCLVLVVFICEVEDEVDIWRFSVSSIPTGILGDSIDKVLVVGAG
jgi:hypothetical protein